jgi:hypothetical protein
MKIFDVLSQEAGYLSNLLGVEAWNWQLALDSRL